MKTLIIVESPSKAKTIEKFLGRNYKVKASVGHIRDLPKSTLGVDIENNFEPKYITIRGKAPIVNELKKEAKKADRILLATDPDREGEAISWHLAFYLKLDKDEKNRVEFNEITKDTVKNAIKNPRKIDQHLVDAQQARRILDRLVGYKISPILWRKVRKGLSAGRVQSVATKIICDKEEEIQKFKPTEYWTIELEATNSKRRKILFEFYGKNDKKLEINNEEEANAILNEIKDKDLIITSITKSQRKRKPYNPFTTSTLQQEANNKLNFPARKTMQIAQKLYEGINIKGKGKEGLITYMRTDSIRLSDEIQQIAKDTIIDKYGKEYFEKYSYKNKSKNVQDAHEAIRPAHIEYEPIMIKDSLTNDEFKLYRLIYTRFLAAQMKDAIFEKLNVNANIGDYNFKVTGSILKFDGFLKVYDYTKVEDKILPDIEEKEKLKVKKIDKTQHFTLPPARYTESTLVKALEEYGIGRPSTYATIISTILSRGYIEKDKKNLIPTELGILVNDLLKEYFKDIVDIEFTADIENKLDEISLGNQDWQSVVSNYYEPFAKDLKIADEKIKKITIEEETDEICEKCGSKMVIKYGRFGKFMACSNYPECKNTKAILNKIDIKCPKCKTGDVIVRKSKKGKLFYGCSNYPKCDFVSWNKPTGKLCPKCNSPMVEGGKTAKYKSICSNKECKYKELEEE